MAPVGLVTILFVLPELVMRASAIAIPTYTSSSFPPTGWKGKTANDWTFGVLIGAALFPPFTPTMRAMKRVAMSIMPTRVASLQNRGSRNLEISSADMYGVWGATDAAVV